MESGNIQRLAEALEVLDSRFHGNDERWRESRTSGNGNIQKPSENLKVGGFAFEVQLSLTEKGQYAVAYGLSCKKDCHELHATDPRRTIP
ncbi:hypothetical protein M5028_07635, partial [Neisseria meningitidis]|nr:hypothetical protein [Neisseria meningitidis]MCL4994934.1 hypothetical protein [Neisseria meningitidis]MCL5707227.1 hypothetical protein [Neisseria meningitidis]MCL5720697.1 hypothetical protein [Neisseria meningitidis]MCL5725212.1 hypothetical protein [Neisseria meningitidis]